jgi:hypothetical protein
MQTRYLLGAVMLIAIIWTAMAPQTLPFFAQYGERTCEGYQKQQWVRALDVALIGPAGLVLASQLWDARWHGWSAAVALVSAGTLLYNLGNYRLNVIR